MEACVICKHGEIKPGTTTLAVERGRMTLVLKGIPARICGTCGEAYFDEKTTARIEAIADELERAGLEVAIQEYAA